MACLVCGLEARFAAKFGSRKDLIKLEAGPKFPKFEPFKNEFMSAPELVGVTPPKDPGWLPWKMFPRLCTCSGVIPATKGLFAVSLDEYPLTMKGEKVPPWVEIPFGPELKIFEMPPATPGARAVKLGFCRFCGVDEYEELPLLIPADIGIIPFFFLAGRAGWRVLLGRGSLFGRGGFQSKLDQGPERRTLGGKLALGSEFRHGLGLINRQAEEEAGREAVVGSHWVIPCSWGRFGLAITVDIIAV